MFSSKVILRLEINGMDTTKLDSVSSWIMGSLDKNVETLAKNDYDGQSDLLVTCSL